MDVVEEALRRDVDYSEAFDRRVRQLGDRLSQALGSGVRHDSDMNYNAGEGLVVYLADDGSVIDDEVQAGFRVTVRVSSRGPLWALFAWRRGPRAWDWLDLGHPLGKNPQVEALRRRIEQVLGGAGLHEVERPLLDEVVPGAVTGLDGAPATVREVLFCEICC